jgi:hypothetical protein
MEALKFSDRYSRHYLKGNKIRHNTTSSKVKKVVVALKTLTMATFNSWASFSPYNS